jgi:aspartate-semialdehyde dehydrogenase
VVIDNSSLYRYDPDVPLIVPEVNPEAVDGYAKKNIIANPNCSTAQMVVALKPLHDRAKIKRVVVSTYQSVSGAGKEGMDELWDQTKGIYVPGQEVAPKKFHQADRLQRDPAYRRLHGGRLHQGRVEDGRRDQEDRRPEDQGHRDLRARAGLRRPFRGDQHRVRGFPRRGRGARHPARGPGIMVVDKREDGGYVTPSNASAISPPSSAASARTRRSRTA